ncbi:FHA domain-containing protein [Janthinobacterium sp. 17J80-10]|uniref:FHA domain-containing protein n=1 Tax=Janthinobacterium sp. 17J80-10 TaxID=2497863 RepID=UPI0010054557|nr:FHA domain-containing protein [Janthinobacterium sp. 17J80-10]QAU34936.1 FHA domain-containing protein [Janthinobacterium sp. 17J80-10]
MAQPTQVLDKAPSHAAVAAGQGCAILLQPLSHKDLAEIRIDDNLFPIGRTEAPFASYPPGVVSDLSRRHARIFFEAGKVYIADLDSKNGTTVNGTSVQQKITRLHDGDEICFAGQLCYRVRLGTAEETAAASPGMKLASLTMTPEHDEFGLQPIVIARFPFLISKTDDTFARYREAHPHQVNYLSRRHAHIFVKGDTPYIEDLGSTNGTFVNGKRLDEHAVRLKDGDSLAIGGHHFVYKVSLQQEAAALEPTVTRLDPARIAAAAAVPGAKAGAASPDPVPASAAVQAGTAARAPPDADKTTFVAAAGSFLDIFCVDNAVPEVEEDASSVAATKAAGEQGGAGAPVRKGRARGKLALFTAELSQAFSGGERHLGMGNWWRLPAVAAVLITAAALAYMANSPERALRGLLADGDYARAASAAAGYLETKPDQPQLKALGTEALLKSGVPQWQAQLRARQFERANAALAGMKQLGRHNSDVQPLLAELEWVGQLEQFVAARGGAEQAVRDEADGERIRRLLLQWDDDTAGHQQAFSTISSYVPDFRDQYAQALSHVRKLALVSGQQAKGGQGNGDQRQPSEIAH